MKNEKHVLKAVFRKDRWTGEIVAFFPKGRYDDLPLPGYICCAVKKFHLCAMGRSHYEYSLPAKPEEYKALLDELTADGMLIEPHTKRSIKKE